MTTLKHDKGDKGDFEGIAVMSKFFAFSISLVAIYFIACVMHGSVFF